MQCFVLLVVVKLPSSGVYVEGLVILCNLSEGVVT